MQHARRVLLLVQVVTVVLAVLMVVFDQTVVEKNAPGFSTFASWQCAGLPSCNIETHIAALDVFAALGVFLSVFSFVHTYGDFENSDSSNRLVSKEHSRGVLMALLANIASQVAYLIVLFSAVSKAQSHDVHRHNIVGAGPVSVLPPTIVLMAAAQLVAVVPDRLFGEVATITQTRNRRPKHGRRAANAADSTHTFLNPLYDTH